MRASHRLRVVRIGVPALREIRGMARAGSLFCRHILADEVQKWPDKRDTVERVELYGPDGGPRKPAAAGDLICLTVEAKLKWYGGELHMVVPPNSIVMGPSRQAKTSLIRAIARAHGWYERILEGKALDQRSLARHAGLTERYVRKVFACAFLAPDIVEAILQGCPPLKLTFEKLCKDIPLRWAEQRRQFGFPPVLSQ
jgi:hypothetical protein